MPSPPKKTLAMSRLDEAGVAYVLHIYEHDPAAETFAAETAEKLGVEAGRVFKTLVAVTDRGKPILGMVPGDERLSLKSLARAAGVKGAEMSEPQAAERVTGYVVGGISPIGGRRQLPAFIDESALLHDTIFVSAGQRGMQLEVVPARLIELLQAVVAPLTT